MKRFRILLLAALVVALASSLMAQATGTKPATGKTDNTAAASSSKIPVSQKIDINSASKDDLDKLPGIGAAYSQKIIDGRPYNTKRDLVTRKIIPQSTYDGIKDEIIAHRMKDQGTKGTTKPKLQ